MSDKQIKYIQGKLEPVIGGKIVQLATDENDEFYGIVIERHGRKYIMWFLSDDEGNCPGSFDVTITK